MLIAGIKCWGFIVVLSSFFNFTLNLEEKLRVLQ